MPIPVIYRKSSPTIASYDFTDIAEGKGIVVFNGYNVVSLSTGTLSYKLTNGTPYSDTIAPQVAVAQSNTYAKVQDIDFDAEFNLPKRIDGDITISVTLGATDKVNNDVKMFGVLIAKHYDGTTETELGRAETRIIDQTNITGAYSETMNVVISDIERNFKKGETLRITLEVWAQEGATSGGIAVGFGCDPQDRNDDNSDPIIQDADTTKFQALVPFRIET